MILSFIGIGCSEKKSNDSQNSSLNSVERNGGENDTFRCSSKDKKVFVDGLDIEHRLNARPVLLVAIYDENLGASYIGRAYSRTLGTGRFKKDPIDVEVRNNSLSDKGISYTIYHTMYDDEESKRSYVEKFVLIQEGEEVKKESLRADRDEDRQPEIEGQEDEDEEKEDEEDENNDEDPKGIDLFCELPEEVKREDVSKENAEKGDKDDLSDNKMEISDDICELKNYKFSEKMVKVIAAVKDSFKGDRLSHLEGSMECEKGKKDSVLEKEWKYAEILNDDVKCEDFEEAIDELTKDVYNARQILITQKRGR